MNRSATTFVICRTVVLIGIGAASALFFSGCVTGMLADRIVAAPNRNGLSKELRDPKVIAGTEANYATSWREKVGPPAAEIAVAVIDPADYQFVSTVEFKPPVEDSREMVVTCKWNTELKANGHLDPTVAPRATLVLLHGIMMSKESMHTWALYFAQQGYRIVLVDLRGHGRSTGSWIGFGAWEVGDLTKVIDGLQQRQLLAGKLGVFGISYGGAIAIQWAAHDSRIATVVALAPLADPQVAIWDFARGIDPQAAGKLSAATFAQAEAKAAKRAGFSWNDVNVVEAIKRVRVPVLLFHGQRDTWIPPQHSELLAAAAPPGSRRDVTPDDSHLSLALRFDLVGPPTLAWFEEKLAVEPAPARPLTLISR